MTETQPDILILARLPDFVRLPLESAYRCHDYANTRDPDALIAEIGPKIRGLTLFGPQQIPPGLIERLPNLQIISVYGVGYEGVPVELCRTRSIKVTHTPDVLTDDVADIALALILMLARDLLRAATFVRAGHWPSRPFSLGAAVGGKTCGIFGLGRIGRAVARRVQTCGMQVAYYGRSRQEVPYRYVETLLELAAVADFLVVATPGGEATQGAVNAEVLRALGDGKKKSGRKGALINVARGAVVDEQALIAALETGTIKGAGLDVFADEPNVPAGLMARDDVVLLPHVGSATAETRKAMGNLVIENFSAYFAGRPLVTPIPELAL